MTGTFDFQILANEQPGAKVLFDQSVELGMTLIALDDLFTAAISGVSGGLTGLMASAGGSFGIGLYTYFFINSGSGKFKTRIVDGNPVKNVIETAGVVAPPAPGVGPEQPGEVILSNLRQTQINVRMPGLPARANTFDLLASGSAAGPFQVLATGLAVGAELDVSNGPFGVPPQDIWFQLRAVGTQGVALGNKVRDAWPEFENGVQVAGYEGWKHTHSFTSRPPTIFAEQGAGYTDDTPSVSTGGAIRAVWRSPFYAMNLPPGCVIRPTHDEWISESAMPDRFFFQISYKPAPGQVAVRDPNTGETWQFYPDGGKIKVARSKRRGRFQVNKVWDPVVHGGGVGVVRAMRNGSTLRVALQTGLWIQVLESVDSGRTWDGPMKLVDGVTLMDAEMSDDGAQMFVIGKASRPDGAIATGNIVRCVLRRSHGEATPWILSSKDKIEGPVFDDDTFAADAGAPVAPASVTPGSEPLPLGETAKLAAGTYTYTVSAVGLKGRSAVGNPVTLAATGNEWGKLTIAVNDAATLSFEVYRNSGSGTRRYLGMVSADAVPVGGSAVFYDRGDITPGSVDAAAAIKRSGSCYYWVSRVGNTVRMWVSTDMFRSFQEVG